MPYKRKEGEKGGSVVTLRLVQTSPAEVQSECWEKVRQWIWNRDQRTLLQPLFACVAADGSELTALPLCIGEELSLLHSTDTKAALLPPPRLPPQNPDSVGHSPTLRRKSCVLDTCSHCREILCSQACWWRLYHSRLFIRKCLNTKIYNITFVLYVWRI